MNGDALIELTFRYGPYGRQRKTVAVQISEDLTDELMGGIELSNDPFSLFVASPGFLGGRGDALTIRRRTLKMRREVAQEIARAMIPALIEAFGVNDTLDGYKADELEGVKSDVKPNSETPHRTPNMRR